MSNRGQFVLAEQATRSAEGDPTIEQIVADIRRRILFNPTVAGSDQRALPPVDEMFSDLPSLDDLCSTERFIKPVTKPAPVAWPAFADVPASGPASAPTRAVPTQAPDRLEPVFTAPVAPVEATPAAPCFPPSVQAWFDKQDRVNAEWAVMIGMMDCNYAGLGKPTKKWYRRGLFRGRNSGG